MTPLLITLFILTATLAHTEAGSLTVKNGVIHCFPDGKDGVITHQQIEGKNIWVDAIRRDGKVRQMRVTCSISGQTKTPVKLYWPLIQDGTVTWNMPVTRDGDIVSASVPWNGVLIGDLMDVNEGATETAALRARLGVTSGADPSLPVIFNSGDSICLGYWPYLEAELNNEANIYHQNEVIKDMPKAGNAHHAHLAYAFLENAYKDPRFQPKWLLMNFGLHMIATHQNNVAGYGQWIEKIDDLAKRHHAQLIWVMTTPFQQAIRPEQNLVVIKFNEEARKIATARHIPVVDLHAATLAINKDLGDAKTYVDGTHFTDEAKKHQAAYIAARIREIIKARKNAKP